jgi:hypothetical protein
MKRTTLLIAASLFVSTCLLAQSKGLVINEIYIGGVRTLLANDSYIEVYNPTANTLYLDGCLLARVTASSGGMLNTIAEAWKFPGTVGGKTLPVTPGQFVVICPGAQKVSGGLDFSNADYETYAGIPILEQDNPSSKNLRKLGAGQITTDINLSQTLDAVVLTTGEDTIMTDGIPESQVIDGVQYSTTTASILLASIDAGFTGGSGLKLGVTMERSKVGVTTHNSAVDFSLFPKPSPGYQSGSEPEALPKGSELFPLDLGKYVFYNAYETDTLGIINSSSLTNASTTVWREDQSVGGFSNASWVKDTSGISLGFEGLESNLRYRADENEDIDVYADQEFVASFVSPFFAAFVQTPDIFVDYIKVSAGFKTPYPILTLNQDIDFQGVTATINVVTTGSFQGIDSVSVPAGTFDTSYIFNIKADVSVTAFGFPVASFSGIQKLWLVRGIGVVKTNSPTVNAGGTPIIGSERQMNSYGTRTINSVTAKTVQKNNYRLSPNPASTYIELSLTRPKITGTLTVLLYDVLGNEVRRYEGSPVNSLHIEREGLVSGTYIVHIMNGSHSELHRVVFE